MAPPDDARILIDNSVWARLSTHPAVAQALRVLVTRADPSTVFVCPPVVLEYGYCARSGEDHSLLMQQLDRFVDCPVAPDSAEVLGIQNALWNSGLLRAAGTTDVLIAAYAIANDATLVHYDTDFELIQTVAPQLRQRWIVSRGSL